jgi:adenine-specific DNA-methyltransferase
MPRQTKQKRKKKAIETLEHQDTRLNIPTGELASFVADDEKRPETLLYPRDPSLDPQLVWKGKDEQDPRDLTVPVVPVYIQEKIHPLALIENLRDTGRPGEPEPEQLLFERFDGLDTLEAKLEFYQHEKNWKNRMILGDSLFVMTSLAEKERLRGKVQMIYMDPPYGIKFGSNWQVSTRKRDVRDGKPEHATREPEQIKAFRDTWELGIHSYLSYLRDRLTVAREILTESGSIFVQIGDENVHLVRCILEEVFGSENFVVEIHFRKTGGHSDDFVGAAMDHILWYSKDKAGAKRKFRRLFQIEDLPPRGDPNYVHLEFPDGSSRRMTRDERLRRLAFPDKARVFRYGPATSPGPSRSDGPVIFQGREFLPEAGRHWAVATGGTKRGVLAGRIAATGSYLGQKLYWDEIPNRLDNVWDDTQSGGFVPDQVYVVQTTPKVIERCLLMTTDPGDLVLDPTCGAGTTARVAEQWGRRWITIDTSRVALALARTRLMTAKYPYYLLSDSPEGAAKESAITGIALEETSSSPKYEDDVRKGFVYKRVPHITLKLIANNEEIDEIDARFEKELEPLRAKLNERLSQSWEEWKVPREPDEEWSKEARDLHDKYWKLRRKRQEEIDASIARQADQEILVDQPYEDKSKVRVTGPFTVESLAPHRVLSADQERPASEQAGDRDSGSDFVGMILENLKKAGVQNTKRKERLEFDRLEPFAGRWIQAAGEYTSAEGESRRVAISLGPEHGAVGPQQLRESAKEAVQGVGFDLLLVLGFAFDPHVSEAAEAISPDGGEPQKGFVTERQQQFGKLPVLLVRMNPDLSMGDELLKKTGAGNLFTVFGDPDIEIRSLEDGQLEVEIRGLDIYDPTTGEIRSSSTGDIACWFLDTAYDGESFFVRHAYFTGADEPYEKLKRALRAEIDPDAWDSLYRTVSRPFDRPKTGKIAIKMINHYGDEVLKVYQVS